MTEDSTADAGRVESGQEPAMVAQGRAIVAAAAARSIPVRLVGGVAIWLRGSAAARAALGRGYPDIDLVAHKRQSRALRSALEEEGFEPERVFNATHGARRLLYRGPGGNLWEVMRLANGDWSTPVRMGKLGELLSAPFAAVGRMPVSQHTSAANSSADAATLHHSGAR